MAIHVTPKPQPPRHSIEPKTPEKRQEIAHIEKKVATNQSLTHHEQVVLHSHLYGYFTAAGVKQHGTLEALGNHEIKHHQHAAVSMPQAAAPAVAPTMAPPAVQTPAQGTPPQNFNNSDNSSTASSASSTPSAASSGAVLASADAGASSGSNTGSGSGGGYSQPTSPVADPNAQAAPANSGLGAPMDARIAAPAATTGGAGFTDQEILDMLINGLASRASIASFDPKAPEARIGDPSKAAQWDLAKAHRLNLGIKTAAQFFPGIAPADLAHLIIAEGLHESTGDTHKNVGGKPGDGMGFMQATPQSVVKDFMQFGTVVKAADGSVVLDPKVSPNLADPAVNVALFAWYSANSLAAGTSLDGKLTYNNPATVNPANKDYGNAMLTWFSGPNNDRHAAGNTFNDSQYIKQTQDYFTQSGFGDAAKFQSLLSKPLDSTLRNVRGQ
jgi:hypothetical protein